MWVREVDRTGEDGFLAAFELALYSSAAQAPHVWLRVRDKLCAVPLSQPTRILISIKDDDLIVTVGNSNGFAQSLLGYLDDGDFVSARTIGLSTVEMTKDLEIARETLYDKLNNPAAAAIAGYYLVRIAGNALFIGEQGQEWRRWISNLASWFEWLPDGAVIAGYAALRAGNVSAATEYLLMASRRGLPFYSVGLRLLVDSLRLVSKADTKNAADLRDALEWASNALRSSARATQTTMLRCDHGAGQLLVAWKPRPVPVPVIADSENITAVTAKRSLAADDIRARNSLKVLAAAFTAVLIAFVTTLYFRLSHFADGTDEHPDDADHDAGQQP